MKNIKKYIKEIIAIIVVIAMFIGISIYCKKMHFSDSLIGGWVASFIISWLFYSFSVKKEIAKVEENLNEQFNQYREFLNKVHGKSTESLLKTYKTLLVDQLESDMAEIWDVRPGAIVGTDVSLLDPTAMDNADDKYSKIYKKLHERSDEILNNIIKNNKNIIFILIILDF